MEFHEIFAENFSFFLEDYPLRRRQGRPCNSAQAVLRPIRPRQRQWGSPNRSFRPPFGPGRKL